MGVAVKGQRTWAEPPDDDPRNFLSGLDEPEFDRVEQPDPHITGGAILWLFVVFLLAIALGTSAFVWLFFEANT